MNPLAPLHEVRDAQGRLRERGELRDGLREGPWQAWHENGALYAEYSYRAGVPYGRWANYYLDGRLKCERHFVSGLEHGTRTTCYTRGIVWVEDYVLGQKHGLCLELDFEGNLRAERRYTHGVEI